MFLHLFIVNIFLIIELNQDHSVLLHPYSDHIHMHGVCVGSE